MNPGDVHEAAGGTQRGAPLGRVQARRRALPNGRAVLGGVLVAVASLATYGQWSAAAATPRHAYVVAARPIAPGRPVTAADLRVEALDLPASVRAGAFTDVRRLVGASVVGPLRAGELVQAGNVAAGGTAPAEVSFGIEPARALDGAVAVGEHVDLVATYGQDAGAWSTVVARRVLVTGVGRADAVGPAALVVTVGLDDESLVLPVTHAARTGVLTVVRTRSTAAGGGDDPGDTYRASGPGSS